MSGHCEKCGNTICMCSEIVDDLLGALGGQVRASGRRRMLTVTDLFAGPGGWDLAAQALGMDVLGIEFDDAACATRVAANLKTLQADVSELDPKDFPCEGFIASPPCQAFSMAGKGAGRNAIHAYVRAIEQMGEGQPLPQDAIARACNDDRAHLVLEPLRWILELTPNWIALEQVAPVQPIWDAMKPVLESRGYSVWTGVLSAEQFGVPQTRKRAFLIASQSREVRAPAPTHQRYVSPKLGLHEKQADSLFDGGDRQRIVHPADRGLLPWVSMAEALGWAEGKIGFPRRADTPSNGAGDDVIELDGVEYRARNLRDAEEPAQVITEKTRSWQRWALRAGTNANDAVRGGDEPAPTIRYGERLNDVSFVEVRRGGERIHEGFDPHDAPSDTVTSRIDRWQLRANAQTNAAVRVSQREAAILQGFPPDYPWQGSKTKKFQQIGNAVPPGLARAVLAAVTPQRGEEAA